MANEKIFHNLLKYSTSVSGLSSLSDYNLTPKFYVDNLISGATSGITTNLSSLSDTTISSPIDGELLVYENGTWQNLSTINGDITILGDLYISGTTTTIDVSNLNIGDNLILINSGETSSGVTLLNAGIEVDRGSGINYQFIFNETDDVFKIGEIGALQPVATRQDIPTNTGVAYWDNVTNSFLTSGNIIFDGNDLLLPNMTTGIQSNIVYYNISTGELTYGTSSVGTVTTVSSTTTNQLTVISGSTTPSLSVVTGAVVDTGTALATGDQIYDFVIGLGYTTNTGTVTSVGISVPTGLSVTNTPITTSGTIDISLQSGYSIPTTTSQTNWNTASIHVTSDGTDHTYIDQDLRTTASPTFSGITSTSDVVADSVFRSNSDTLIIGPTNPTNGNVYIYPHGYDDFTGGTLFGQSEVTMNTPLDVNGRIRTFDSVESNTYIGSYNTSLVLSTNTAGTVSIRPIGKLITGAESTFTPTLATIGSNMSVTGTITAIGYNDASWNAAYTHITSDGSDHTFINQDLRTTASPTFNLITSTTDVIADSYFRSSNGSAVLGTGSSGTVLLRPTLYNSATAQSSFTPTLATIGTDVSVNGTINAADDITSAGNLTAFQYIASSNQNTVIGTAAGSAASGTVYLRPYAWNNAGSQSTFTTALATIGTNMSVSGSITATGDINGQGKLYLNSQNTSTSSTTNLGTSSSHGIVLRNSSTTNQTFTNVDFVTLGASSSDYNTGRICFIGNSSTSFSDIYNYFSFIMRGSSGYAEMFRFCRTGSLHADGNITAYSTLISSDIRLKENVETIEDSSLDKLMSLRPVLFDWKDDKKKRKNKVSGFIAQEMEEIIPGVVVETIKLDKDENDMYKNINYNELSAYLVHGIQEQQSLINDDKKEILELKKEILKLKDEVNILKNKNNK